MHPVFIAVWPLIFFHLYGVSYASEDEDGINWGYDKDNGPDEWCKTIPECCGFEQSPIDLYDNQSLPSEFPKLVLTKYGIRHSILLTNSGRSVVITLSDGLGLPTISGGNLQDVYVFDNMHFHWGHDDTVGSEHTINGLHYPLEGHLVHFNSKYASFDEAKSHSDGIAVLAVLFKITCLNNTNFATIVNTFQYVEHADDSALPDSAIILRKFLPDDIRSYYRYKGSLTTPPCSEVVTWTVFTNPIGISERQLKEFRNDIHSGKTSQGRTLKPGEDPLLQDNHRDVQKGDRIVFHNHPVSYDQIISANDCKEIPVK